jgi:ADP-ribose pyrophosphatase YjhB (NUDIX family)/predicted enzyme related to lactoylglutathione lyase
MSPNVGPLLRKVDCLALPVPDLDAAIAFYESIGQGLLWRTSTAAGLRLPDSDAELVVQTERPLPETDLTVESVDEAVRRFTDAGGQTILAPFDIAIGRCAIVTDPWDNRLVLLDNSNGTFVTDDHGNVSGVESAATAKSHNVAVYVVLERQGRVLFMMRAGTGYRDGEYGLPSGKVNEGEVLGEAAARELSEEVGIEVQPAHLLLRHVVERRTKTGQWLDCFFVPTGWTGEPANNEPEKCGGLAWLDPVSSGVSDYVGIALTAMAAGVAFSAYAGR